MQLTRKIVEIDEERCNGCGQCVTACAEGALRVVDGKARLVSEIYCDGLGACLGDCPQDAIRIVERPAEAFDEHAVAAHLERQKAAALPCGCPGSLAKVLSPTPPASPGASSASALANWPVQLKLAPVQAPYFPGANVVLSADCVPCAVGDFHARFVAGRILLIACPKLDDAAFYTEKLAAMLAGNAIRSLTVLHMEVPCCSGLIRIVQAAMAKSQKTIPVTFVKIGIDGGGVLDEVTL